MKSDKKLQAIFDKRKGENRYYGFEDFKKDARNYLKDIKKGNVVCSMTVSRSGMLRHFNTLHYNMLLNVCYNNKMSWDSVKVGGCGMDMHWHLLYSTCVCLTTEKEQDNYPYNSKCSSQPIL
jgi:hypothetical protein